MKESQGHARRRAGKMPALRNKGDAGARYIVPLQAIPDSARRDEITSECEASVFGSGEGFD
jgi:hypothetical protein